MKSNKAKPPIYTRLLTQHFKVPPMNGWDTKPLSETESKLELEPQPDSLVMFALHIYKRIQKIFAQEQVAGECSVRWRRRRSDGRTDKWPCCVERMERICAFQKLCN
ncbi:unnamed protein product [Ceratitis capitata]|uniref:(Mediterranean fruit fly) hypothetical protein n=1 Tax=Ceratitis capitata TaxID=7213 RepID=A0A811VCK8_CERCA|nr:unnamed protein product [Ceratitis capitata]